MKQVVVADGNVEEVSRCDALRIVVVVFLIWCWHLEVFGTVLGCKALGGWRTKGTGNNRHAIASQPRLKFLIRGQRQTADRIVEGYHTSWETYGTSPVHRRR